jgi:ClpP class serine protease
MVIAASDADIGSIGVFMAHTDCSKFNEMNGVKVTYLYAGEHKVEGNQDEPLSPDAAAYYTGQCEAIYSAFKAAVARGRGVTPGYVEANMGAGRCMSGSAALKVKMIDKVATFETALEFGKPRSNACGSDRTATGRPLQNATN